MKKLHELKSAIEKVGGRMLSYYEGPTSDRVWGGAAMLNANTPRSKIVIFYGHDFGWDHVSAHVRGPQGPCRIPSYDEMVLVKRVFFKDDETAMELHVPPAEHINKNPHVLHLWRPLDQDIPRPPEWMV